MSQGEATAARRVLVACEFSGTVREAFAAKGWDAWSCDLLATEVPGNHYQEDVISIAYMGGPWDLMIAHPPCTFLTVAANKWMNHPKYPNRAADRKLAVDFFMELYNAPIERVCIENPIGIMSTAFRKPDQVVQPWMFGHGETKATCFWLKGLPKLSPTHAKNDLFQLPEPLEREQRLHKLPPSATRWMERSRTFKGIAAAMADQWGAL